ncbi:ABC transporter ATP-binding protein [Verrucosispora sp. WMMA2121]
MHNGRIIEQGPTAQLTTDPRHPYTQSLLAATPTVDLKVASRTLGRKG